MKAIILDDELHCIESLEILLTNHTNVEIIGTFNNPLDALKVIETIQFDILFVDIEMPELNGLEFVKAIDRKDFHIVFTTAYDEYALQAFKVSALDYLLKPISKSDLLDALQRIDKAPPMPRVLAVPLVSRINKIAIPSMAGLEMIALENILYLEADGNYVRIFLKSKDTLLTTRTLKEMELQLLHLPFVRIHNSYIVHLNSISKYVKGDGGYVVLENGTSLNVSRSRKEDLIRHLQ